jgi:hypothetical protein
MFNQNCVGTARHFKLCKVLCSEKLLCIYLHNNFNFYFITYLYCAECTYINSQGIDIVSMYFGLRLTLCPRTKSLLPGFDTKWHSCRSQLRSWPTEICICKQMCICTYLSLRKIQVKPFKQLISEETGATGREIYVIPPGYMVVAFRKD